MLRAAARVLGVLGKWWEASGDEHLKECGDVEVRRQRLMGLERGFVDRRGEERESASMVKREREEREREKPEFKEGENGAKYFY